MQTIWSNKYVSISKWIESFIDTDLKVWDNVNYILKTSDWRNYSQISDELNFNMLNINISTWTTINTGVLETNTWTIIKTEVVNTLTWEIIVDKQEIIIDKFLPIFKTKTLSDFMLKFDKKIDKREYKKEVRIIRNNIIKLLKDYEDKKNNLKFVRSELVKLVVEFVKVW